MHDLSSRLKRNVVRRDIHHMNAEAFQETQYRLHLRPARAELLLFLPPPVGEHLLGEIRSAVKKAASEVEHERPGNDGHLDGPQLIVVTQKLRNLAAADPHDPVLSQTQVDIALPAVIRLMHMDFQCSSRPLYARFRLVFHNGSVVYSGAVLGNQLYGSAWNARTSWSWNVRLFSREFN